MPQQPGFATRPPPTRPRSSSPLCQAYIRDVYRVVLINAELRDDCCNENCEYDRTEGDHSKLKRDGHTAKKYRTASNTKRLSLGKAENSQNYRQSTENAGSDTHDLIKIDPSRSCRFFDVFAFECGNCGVLDCNRLFRDGSLKARLR